MTLPSWRTTTRRFGEAAAVEVAVDAEMERLRLVAAAQEIGVKRMRRLARIDRSRRCGKRLRDYLPAKDALAGRLVERGESELVLEPGTGSSSNRRVTAATTFPGEKAA